jgi:glycine hydroxymethyltransferase
MHKMPAMTLPWESEQVQARVKELSSQIPVGYPDRLFELLDSATNAALESFKRSVSLYAGANVLSDHVKHLASIELGSRPTLGLPGDKFPTGVDVIDIIEVAATQAIRGAMNAKFADVRMPTATLANLAVLTTLTEPGDTIAALPEPAGGHISHRTGAPRVRGLRVATLPYDYDAFDVDLRRLPHFLATEQPKLLILGGSLMLRPHNVSDIAAIAHQHGILTLYDGSHVAGLIAGGRFQKPLDEGADILTFSTYKSFGGPAGGAICTNDAALAERLSVAVYPTLTANYDVGRLGPIAMAASELVAHGSEYAGQCIENARQFGRYLTDNGLVVLGQEFGFTESHQLIVDVRRAGGGRSASQKLGKAGILLSPSVLPLNDAESELNGLRIGTQELTRRGFEPAAFKRLARILAEIVRDKSKPDRVAGEVARLLDQRQNNNDRNTGFGQ